MTAAVLTDDAAGITDKAKGAARRVGGVVDKLLASAPVDQQVQQVPVDLVVEHPRNPKGRTDDVDDLVAGIKAVGITNPLIVATGAAYNAGRLEDDKAVEAHQFVIVGGGHRRRKAAELAGLSTVPCIVRDDLADAKGRRAALFENLHRRQLDAFEEAAAFNELVRTYKVSQRDLAADVGCNQSHISKRLKLLNLPSTVRASVDVGKVSIGDALEFARIADQGPIFDVAWDRFNRSGWLPAKRAVTEAIQEHEAKVAREKALTAVKDKGLRILSQRPTWYDYSRSEPHQLDDLSLKDEQAHETEPCHAVYVGSAGELVTACTDVTRHEKNGGSPQQLPKRIADKFKSTRAPFAQNVQDRQRRALRKIEPARAEFIRLLLLPLSLSDSDTTHLIDDALIGHVFHRPGSANDVAKIVLQILGYDAGKKYPANVVQELDSSTADQELRAALPLVTAAAYYEARLRSTWTTWGPAEAWWLRLLERHGYELSEVEVEKLKKVKEPEPDTPPLAVATCRQCGCTDARACDGGCSWVAPDLCSACSDVVDAGWVEPEPAVVG